MRLQRLRALRPWGFYAAFPAQLSAGPEEANLPIYCHSRGRPRRTNGGRQGRAADQLRGDGRREGRASSRLVTRKSASSTLRTMESSNSQHDAYLAPRRRLLANCGCRIGLARHLRAEAGDGPQDRQLTRELAARWTLPPGSNAVGPHASDGGTRRHRVGEFHPGRMIVTAINIVLQFQHVFRRTSSGSYNAARLADGHCESALHLGGRATANGDQRAVTDSASRLCP